MKIKIVIICFFILLSALVFFSPSLASADTCANPTDNPCWKIKKSMPTARRDLGIATDSSGKIYAVGGYNGNFVNTLEMYTPEVNSWTSKTSVPVARNNMGFTFNPVNGKFYFGGGYNGQLHNDLYEYDPAADKWTARAPMLTARMGLRFASASNGKIYAIGGGFLNGTYANNVEEYDPPSDTWTTKSAIPNPRSDAGLVTAPNGKIYLIGGGIQGSSIASVDEYDPIKDTWTTKSSMPAPRTAHAASINKNGNIYVAGGYDLKDQFYNDTVYEYNPTSDKWLTRTQLPIRINSLAMSLGGDGSVYAIGGWTQDNEATNTNYAGFTQAGTQLNVPYFSQNALPWGPTEYDHANSLSFTNLFGSATMDRWGCVVTSAAMILRYHGMVQMIDGSELTPGTVNNWLKTHQGYSTGGNGLGTYSSIIWGKISELTRDLKAAGKSIVELEHYWPSHNETTTQLLKDDISLRNSPSILGVNGNSHYIVAKGFNDNTFLVNDPEWEYPDLTNFSNDTYGDAHRYIRSNTDLSSIELIVNPNIEILVTDSQNRKTGKIVQDGVTSVYNDIQDARYNFEPPLANPNENGVFEELGTGVNRFIYSKPENDEYKITLSSKNSDTYTLNIITFEVDGDSFQEKSYGSLESNNQNQFFVSYSQTEPPTTKKDVTFSSVIQDIKNLRDIKLINYSFAKGLINIIKQAEMLYNKGKPKQAEKLINAQIIIINKTPIQIIDQRAKEIMLYDLKELKKLIEK